MILLIHDVDRLDETFGNVRIEIKITGENLTDEEADVWLPVPGALQCGT